MTLVMADQDVIERYEIVGVGRLDGPLDYKNAVKPLWRWRCHRQADIHALLSTMWPFLGVRRQEQAAKIIAWIESRPKWATTRRKGETNRSVFSLCKFE